MTTKIIAVLANSVFGRERLIAGREFYKKDGKLSVGPWVRPVSDMELGSVGLHDIKLEDKTQPKILDLVQISLEQKSLNAHRPECWSVKKGTPWKRLSSLVPKHAKVFRERPDDLWLEHNSAVDRVSAFYLNSMENVHSACLIKPETFRMESVAGNNPLEPGIQVHQKAIFRYNKQLYELSLHDPIIEEKYHTKALTLRDETKTVELDCGSNCLLSITLINISQDYYRKVVTSVIELA